MTFCYSLFQLMNFDSVSVIFWLLETTHEPVLFSMLTQVWDTRSLNANLETGNPGMGMTRMAYVIRW